MRAALKKQIAAKNRNAAPGKNEKKKFQVALLRRFGKGRNQPPSHSVTAIDETAIMAEYSARKNNDQRKPLYSVWNPAVSMRVQDIFWFTAKVAAFMYLYIWYRGTFPRYRFDQLMQMGWKVLLPMGLGVLILTASVALLQQKIWHP